MKKFAIAVFAVIITLCGSLTVNANEEAASNGEPYQVRVEKNNKKQTGSFTELEVKNGVNLNSKVERNCYYYYSYYYYTPYVYYRPVYYTTCYYTYYRCRYVVYYNGTATNEANGEKGIILNQTPDAKSPLGKQNLKKGDIITHINGKKIRSVEELDSVTVNSRLTVLKSNKGSQSEPTIDFSESLSETATEFESGKLESSSEPALNLKDFFGEF